jgi:pimeloyl-ACP methyl ester carboxylesterase
LNLTIKTARLPNGIELEYAEQGVFTGTPVIFLHGLSDSWHSFESVLAVLPYSIHAFAISQRGHGDSERPQDGYSIKDFAGDVAEFIKIQNLKSVYIVGHSMGGAVAQQFALDYPQLTKGLILISTDADFNDNPGMPEFYQESLKLKGAMDKKFMDEFQKSTLAKPINPDYYNLLVAEGMKLPADVFKAAFTGLMQAEFSDDLHKITVPVLIFWGERDNFCFLKDQEQLLRGIPHAKFIMYENTGHALHWEEPARFVRDLAGFVAGVND